MKTYYVYMLECADESYYVGMTNNLGRRMHEHKSGYNPESYTAQRLPVKLVYFTEFQYVWDAIHWEKQLKDWSRAKKEALIYSDWDSIKKLAKKKFG